jgi:signal transduction histidine kinase/DNA-binding NarL/FixJ family response regulator
VFDGVRPLIRQCLDDGIAYHTENDLLLYKRGENGQFVEKYHTWSFIPIFDLDGKIPGIYNPTTDSTDAVLAYRRQQTTKSISDRISIARTVDELFKGIAEAMEGNSKDVPFLLCYGIEEKDKLGEVELTLQSSVGVPEGHSAAPRSTRLKLPSHGRSPLSGGSDYDPLDPPTFSGKSRSRLSIDLAQSLPERGQDQSWPITEALLTRRSVYVEDCSTLIAKLPLRRWEQLPESAIVVPICNEMSNDSPRGLFIMGLNLLRPLDDEYRAWIEVTRSQLTSALFSVHAYAAEHQRVADKDRLERAKTAWFQGAAHDLRSPLTLVVGPLGDVLESNDLKPDHRQALVLAQRNVQHIQRLVNALLDFSRIEAGKLTARYVLTDLGRFVDDLTALFRPAVVRRGIEYTILTAQHETLTYVDPTLLETVIVNLLSNALKYTEKGSITTQLVYTATHAEIAVIDTGFGIPRAEVHAVTDRFHRATTASYRGTEGTGIGLALAKQIVQLHGGDLTIESRVAEESPDGSHGSTFKVRIPLVERDTDDNEADLGRGFGTYGKALAGEAMQWPAADLENEMIETSRSSTSENGDSSATSEGLLFEKSDLLLIVDDNHDIRRYIKQIFSPFCKVVEASNGYDAIELARQSSPDLILSDLMMPRMTGQELLSAIRQDSATRSMPVVLLSAATDDHSRLLALTTGADDFISKPFKPKELLARVNLHMQLGKRRIKLEELFHQREQEISLLSDYCPAGIIRQTADGNMIYGNASWREYAGMQGEQDLNNWIEKVRSDDAQVLMTRLQEFRHGDERELQQTWKWLNGRVVTGTFIRLDKVIPGMSGILGCFSDISYQEERILQAETRRIEAEESRRQQELLVDFTSHEIRTPVSAILQCSALVKENLMALMKTISDVTGAKGITNFVPTDDMMADLEEDIEALESEPPFG